MSLSVVLASCRSSELVAVAIARLLPQCLEAGAELIVARSVPTGFCDPEGTFAGCRIVTCPEGATLPEIRGAGLMMAKGDWVVLVEDNCVPRRDWLARLATGFAADVEVVGGTMGNAQRARAIDAGAYFAEYGYFGPSRREPGGGASPFVTGANVAYHKSVVTEGAVWASAGDWEGVIHHRLANQGARFALVHDAIMEQNLHYQFGDFCRDRYVHGMQYAAVRSEGVGWGKRLAMASATPALPPLMTWRAWRNAGRPEVAHFLRSLPFTLAFFTAWGVGEAAGYLGRRAS